LSRAIVRVLAAPLIPSIFNPRTRSLVRGSVIVLASLAIATLISKFPHLRAAPWLVLPALGCMVGTLDTARCMQRRWSFYHGGVLLCVYMDLMATTLVLFFLLYPYLVWLGKAR
jgi:hypothetical protein